MATETEERTEDQGKVKTRDQVAALLKEGKSAKEIAEKLGKTPATVYVHIRNLNKQGGGAPRKRGRPPKAQNGGEAQTRSRPPVSKPAASNGEVSKGARFPVIRHAVEQELRAKRNDVAVLEKMLDSME